MNKPNDFDKLIESPEFAKYIKDSDKLDWDKIKPLKRINKRIKSTNIKPVDRIQNKTRPTGDTSRD
jgi:hypothetical protein